MTTRPRRARPCPPRRGTEILELALCLPILLAVAFATIQFGYHLYLLHTLHAAAREGARSAAPAGATATDVSDAVNKVMATGGFTAGTDYDYTISPSVDPGEGKSLTVKVTFKKDLTGIRPLSGFYDWGSKPNPSASVVMRKE